jgi:hypothetical protein
LGDGDVEEFSVTEKPVSRDYRSFAANMFGTVAFKMLEWLTPNGIEEMSRRTREYRAESDKEDEPSKPEDGQSASQNPHGPASIEEELPSLNGEHHKPDESNGQVEKANGVVEAPRGQDEQQQRTAPPASRPTSSRRNSNARVRTTSSTKPKRQLSMDAFPPEAAPDDAFPSLLRSPRLNSQTEKTPRNLKTPNGTLSRPISQLTTAGFFDDVPLEKMPPPKPAEIKTRPFRGHLDGTKTSEPSSSDETLRHSASSSDGSCSNMSFAGHPPEQECSFEDILPQALSRLNPDVIDFICDVLQEDDGSERHMLHPSSITTFHTRVAGQGKPLKRRKTQSHKAYPPSLTMEWKLFAEQTMFYILSDPPSAIRSFTKKGSLYDSQTLWYCMLRMTRVAPSLVFHSLWMAAASLFAPPKSLQSLRSPTAKLFPRNEQSLSNMEAGWLMSICLHALVAAAPLVSDPRQLYDMSRIRSHGLSLAGSGAIARQPAALCLQYNDAFSDDLALRLARRLFAAITARRCFDDLNDSNFDDHDEEQADVLMPLFSQLDFLNMDAVYILNFSFSDRALHETRVPTLLLDWARAVMLNDWDGKPEVSGEGSFGGALALIDAMCKFFPFVKTLETASELTSIYRQETTGITSWRCPVSIRILCRAPGCC